MVDMGSGVGLSSKICGRRGGLLSWREIEDIDGVVVGISIRWW